MSAVATTRLPLALVALPSNGAAAHSPPAFALRAMHPDCLLLQQHGVTSPRLSASGAVTRGGGGGSEDDDETPAAAAMSKEDAEEQLVRIDNDNDEEDDEADEGEAMEVEDERTRGLDEAAGVPEEEDDEEIDAVSLCSDDGSELSVGQEDARSEAVTRGSSQLQQQQQRELLIRNVGAGVMALCRRPSAFSSVCNTSVDGSDARSSVSTEDAAPLAPGDEELGSLRLPPAALPSASPFQEEFLRKSHLYAEELMKHQMQFMAAARASAFTLRTAGIAAQPAVALLGAEAAAAAAGGKAGFRPQGALQAPPLAKHPDMPNFMGIHTHLSAISKMSQLSAAAAAAAAAAAVVTGKQPQPSVPATDALAKLTALGMAAGPPFVPHGHPPPQQPTPSNNQHLYYHHHHHHAHHHPLHNNNNNNNLNLNEPALKFSIDNILKADFGRRITEPLLNRGGGVGVAGGAASACGNNKAGSTRLAARHAQRRKKQAAAQPTTPTTAGPMAMDLTSLMSSSAHFSATLANICTNSNDSSSTAVSSNYGGGAGAGAVGPATDFVLKSPHSSQAGTASACSVSPAPTPGDAAKTTTLDGKDGATNNSNSNNNGSGSSSGSSTTSSSSTTSGTGASGNGPIVWPAWVYCTRYSDRPSSGPRARKPKKPASEKGAAPAAVAAEDKRPRTAFSGSQLARLKHEFNENRYLTEKRRQQLSAELGLNEAQIKIWFQNKRAKLKKSSGTKNPLALQLMAQGLYNHSTVPLTREEEELQELQERETAAAVAAAAAGAGGMTAAVST